MIPFKHTDERVWRAIHQLEFQRIDTKVYEVVMDPETYAELMTDLVPVFLDLDGRRLFGLPIRRDSSMRRGEIALRHGAIA